MIPTPSSRSIINSETLLADLEDPAQPLLNRATQGLYPLGSVFKIITMAAAIESGLYTADSTYYCDTVFKELPGATLYDWTHDYNFQTASGKLTLIGGLIRSCNPWFYHIGLDFYNRGHGQYAPEDGARISAWAADRHRWRGRGTGQVPDMVSQIDATNNAIGQGALLVTPLQVADFMAAIGNGGTLYQPQLIEKIVPPDGSPVLTFKPNAQVVKLPIKPETLQAIQEAMMGVVGKRQTARHGLACLHRAGYSRGGQNRHRPNRDRARRMPGSPAIPMPDDPEHPDIAVAVIVETSGEGSVYAAPIFRRIVELYFQGTPGKLYDWETTYNVTRTPAADAAGSHPGTLNRIT